MLKFSKKIEYGVLAMQYIASKYNEVVSAKEIADRYGVSFDFLSKALQALIKSGFLTSLQGIKGGYMLARKAEEINLSDIIKALEGNSSIVECFAANRETDCSLIEICTLKNPMSGVQKKIDDLFNSLTLAEISESIGLDKNSVLQH